MPKIINVVRSRIKQNPVWEKKKKKKMSQEMDIAPRNMSRVTKQDSGLGAFKRQTGQCLTIALKENRKKISRCLLSYGKERNKKILFTDENIFLVWRKL